MKITAIGLDLAKNVFQVHGVDQEHRPLLRRQLKRAQVVEFFARLEPCLIGIEACATAHFWGRKLSALGHTVRLIAPQYVKPYVKTNKNDARDAEAICEALLRPSLRFVALKSVQQQELLALVSLRKGLLDARTALANQLRGLFVHGARSVIRAHRPGSNPWLDALLERRPKNVAVVALAHRNARVVWALLASGARYRPPTRA